MQTAGCVICTQHFPIALLNISAKGYLCSTCAELVAIKGPEMERTNRLREHNQVTEWKLWLTGYWRLKVKCAECDQELSNSPGFSMRLPPTALLCRSRKTVPVIRWE